MTKEHALKLTIRQIARMTDLSAVKAETTEQDIHDLADAARKHQCICVFTMPCYTSLIAELLAGEPNVGIGGVAGFPSGTVLTRTKAAQARELIAMGCGEIDMVMNVGRLKSGNDPYVLEDIRAVVDVCGEVPLKVILECHHLTDDEIRRACELCIEAGAAFVKTGTGWAPTGATLHNIALMKACVGDRVQIKAAGGVRDLETLLEMHSLGATRFGIGLNSALAILESSETSPGASSDY